MPQPPSSEAPAVDQTGRFTSPWLRFFSALAGSPGPIEAVPVGPSPFTYKAPTSGHVVMVGGTISQFRIIRGRVSFTYPAGSTVPVSAGDTVVVAYSAAPALTFIPG